MAKHLLYVEQAVLNRLVGHENARSFETLEAVYYPLSMHEPIELVPSPRPVPREHLRRDFLATLDDLETAVRHLGYMKSEI